MIDWGKLAKEKGFDTSLDLLSYLLQKKTFKEIAEMLNVTTYSVKRQLIRLALIKPMPVKKQGQAPGTFVCKYCKKHFKGDVRRRCCDGVKCKARRKAEQSLLANKNRAQNRLKQRNVPLERQCTICGNDKSPNKYFCRACHAAVSAGMLIDNF